MPERECKTANPCSNSNIWLQVEKMNKYCSLKKDVAKIYWCMLKLNTSHGVRCHESARIFCNVLRSLEYRVEVMHGGYLLPDRQRMQHSWVENIMDVYGTSLLVETTPHLFFPDLSFREIIEKMIILPNDTRRKKYETVSSDLFFQVLNKKGIEKIDEQIIKVYSSTIIQLLRGKNTTRALI